MAKDIEKRKKQEAEDEAKEFQQLKMMALAAIANYKAHRLYNSNKAGPSTAEI